MNSGQVRIEDQQDAPIIGKGKTRNKLGQRARDRTAIEHDAAVGERRDANAGARTAPEPDCDLLRGRA